MPRLGHKKSRNGCRQCKARHVKCNESKPCSSCKRHGVPCSLVTWDGEGDGPEMGTLGATLGSSSAAGGAERRSASTSRSRSRSRRGSSSSSRVIEEYQNPTPPSTETYKEEESVTSPASSTDTYPFLTKFVHDKDATEQANWARDLELIHHWTTEACLSMCPRDDLRNLWTRIAPKAAMNHTYLMHQILTFSSLHIAHHDVSERDVYHALAIHHQDLAIRAIRPKLANITPENAPFLFATSTLVSMCVFGERALGAMRPQGADKEPLEDLLDAFALLQGMGGLFNMSFGQVIQSPFAPIVSPGNTIVPPQPIFATILERIPEAVSFIGAQSDIPEDIQRECLVQLLALRDVIQHNSQPTQDSREMRTLFFWPLHLKPIFSVWVRERRQPVLVLLAYYAVVLRAGESLKIEGGTPAYWFYTGWAERLINDVARYVDDTWRPVTQWQWDLIMGVVHQQQPQGQKRGYEQSFGGGDEDVKMVLS
ncbi:hypothetical protein K504DRAFT_460085 [Pleomassaria siparia CBS 279.74]|uniref:Zn(2)-C6 fungal-type domain-containing protein n=1 Tax=Pleomassaria siparia CBS 279.74 TaxID=1314801 RepID=A0A6G1K0S4_9PLEO|nr:hypothetical protein K504DRAFT_460085 [Pleomassaria siparia CBS 279.74]